MPFRHLAPLVRLELFFILHYLSYSDQHYFLQIQICSFDIMLLGIEVCNHIGNDIADCTECHGNSFARVHDGYDQHDTKGNHTCNRNQRIGRYPVRQIFYLSAFCNISLAEAILADTDYRIHENVCTADVPDNYQINGICSKEFGQNADQSKRHGDAQCDDRNALLAGLGTDLRCLIKRWKSFSFPCFTSCYKIMRKII